MPKIQLSIKSTYLPTWGLKEGIRDLIQNAKDAEVEHNAPMVIDWYNNTLRIENEGTTIPTKALLLGHTTKQGNSALIGKFGEGLKLSILALVRAGHKVKIRNGSEVWVPTLEHSPTFGEEVLTFSIEGGREAKERIRIEIGGVSKADWEAMRPHFLFLVPPAEHEQVQTYNGTLLTGERFQGHVYVKGILVQKEPSAKFGYDLKDVELDRDRRMVESWNLKYYMKTILLDAANKREDLFERFTAVLENPTLEVDQLDASGAGYCVGEALAERMVAHFQAKYGADAVPVETLAESRDVEHLGKRGIIVTKPMGAVLGKVLGTASDIKSKLQNEVLTTFSWSQLSDKEKDNLTNAVAVVNAVLPVTLDDINIVAYRSEALEGQFTPATGKISLAKRLLAKPEDVLATLIHEVAHRNGGDGDHSHVQQIENTWKAILKNARGRLHFLFD